MSELKNQNNGSNQQQAQPKTYTENKVNSAESEKLYTKMKEGWL